MDEPSSTAHGPEDLAVGPVSGPWGRWWTRVLLFIAHLALLVAAVSLTPDTYFVQLGSYTGSVIVIGTLFLWILLWFARERRTVLLFCGLGLAQTGFVGFVANQFRAEDRLLREITAETTQRQAAAKTQIANFHLDRVFEMLTPGNEFRPEELPGLLENARAANVKARELSAQEEASANEAEKRVAAVNPRAAADFRRGFESNRDRSGPVQKSNEDYITGIERLVSLLIDKQGRYHFTKAGLVFDRPADAATYNQLLDSLDAMQEDAARRSNSQP